MSDLAVANTILQQMGGTHKLSVMIGAYCFVGDDNSVQFAFKGSRKANRCRVTYDCASDLYIFELQRYSKRNFGMKDVCKFKGVYHDMLVSLFEDKTGLYLSL